MENAFGILVSRFRVLLTTMEQKPEVVRDIVLTCVVLHNILRTHQGAGAQLSNPQDDLPEVDLQLAGGPDENVRNPSRVAKQQRDYLKNYFNTDGAVWWQDERI